MGRIVPLLFLAEVTLVAVALISCFSAEDDEIRTLPRAGWVLIILFLPLVGALAWFSTGRTEAGGVRIRHLGSGRQPGAWAARADWMRPQRRVVAPDDDADFLRSLDAKRARRDRELFRRWEDDLSRRDDDLSRRDDEGRRHGPGPNPHPPPSDTPQ